MFQLRIFLSWNDVGSSWWGCEPRDYARSGRWPPLTPSLGSQPHHSAPTSIHSRKIPSWNKIFHDLGYPLSKSLAGKFKVFPSWSIFILSCLKEQENINTSFIFGTKSLKLSSIHRIDGFVLENPQNTSDLGYDVFTRWLWLSEEKISFISPHTLAGPLM